MSMEAEKSTSDETENAKRAAGDFPEALLQYKNKIIQESPRFL